MERIFCVMIGYLLGSFLTAELVVRKRTGMHATHIGSKNPGMANVASQLGIGAGAAVLIGDLVKTAAACLLCRYVLFHDLGRLAVYYAGIGAVLGHNYPVFNRFKGGKGVAVTCMFAFTAMPFYGLLSCIAGLLAVLLSGYLCIGAAVIPAFFIIPSFIIAGSEAGMLAFISFVMMLLRNRHDFAGIKSGKTKRTNLLKKLRK